MASGAAKRYTQAVVGLARERGTFDAWQADLGRLNDLMSDPRVAQFLTSPNVTDEQRTRALETELADAQPETRNLVRLLMARHRLSIIPEIYQLYNDALLAERGIAIADVTTAEPLGPSEREMVRAQLKRIIGKEIELRLRIDPSIIGGVIARVGDQLIDGSVVNHLRQLRARLATG